MNELYWKNNQVVSFSPLQVAQGYADNLIKLTQEEIDEHLKPKEPTSEEKAEQIRIERNELLSASDWTQVSDSPLTQDQQSKWTEYRQYLRDIPQQEGFPNIEVMSFEEFQQDLE